LHFVEKKIFKKGYGVGRRAGDDPQYVIYYWFCFMEGVDVVKIQGRKDVNNNNNNNNNRRRQLSPKISLEEV